MTAMTPKPDSFSSAAILKEIRRVLAIEVRTLETVRRSINPRYAQAVLMLARCKGKIITTGVGKSGFIAQKIAATFSSTGAPAAYLDPGDALHGGLGFVQKQDLVLAVGKSGESDELNHLLPALRAKGARVIAITANPKSTLARHAATVLETPIQEEACPLNLAPTASTTAALAVGDALAVALMSLRGFKAEHFAANHPSGRLGRRLHLLAKDIMRGGESNPVVFVDEPVKRLILE
ncbi:MAG: KpsF/GutQ family sugar-phosphate isomerase, partial [Elusimicrobiota bacterium]